MPSVVDDDHEGIRGRGRPHGEELRARGVTRRMRLEVARALRVSHLCVGGQLDTRAKGVHFLFPIRMDWEHPSFTLPVSYTVEGAGCHMGISERSPPRMQSSSRDPHVLLCRT